MRNITKGYLDIVRWVQSCEISKHGERGILRQETETELTGNEIVTFRFAGIQGRSSDQTTTNVRPYLTINYRL